jgi:hypothetical protein
MVTDYRKVDYRLIMAKELWIYWRLCLLLRQKKISHKYFLEECDVWEENGSPYLLVKTKLLREESFLRVKRKKKNDRRITII